MKNYPSSRTLSLCGTSGEGIKNVKTIRVNLHKISVQEIGLIVDFLKKGKTIAYPTDTIYGLGCSAVDKKAIARIYRLKKREKKKPLLVLISDFSMLRKYFKINPKQLTYLRKIWPGRISVILDKKTSLPSDISAGLSSVAVRLPKSQFLTKMIKELCTPIVSTSLNRSGQKHLDRVDRLGRYFRKLQPDLVIDAGVVKGKPSQLIDLRDINEIKILRK
jgi:tRNA threonylcarbamoyl adenosine modification protein (Sua5/YciO/YrdC/YwlC family)